MTDKVVFEGSNGSVQMYVDKMPGCCGVAVVHTVRWVGVKNKQKLYEEYNNFLKTATNPFQLDRCKIVMTDNDSPDKNPSIYDFCTTMGWMEGEHTPNKKSGNKVVLFELNRQTSRSY